MNKIWQLAEKKSNDLVEQILLNRKIDQKDWHNFLHPDFDHGLHDPFLLPDMEKTIARIIKAIENHEKIGIFGDYDADGIPATALLSTVLKKTFDAEIIVYIPTRIEGYGLNIQGLNYLIEQGINILVTADLGIREIETIEYLQQKNIDTIITDHHEPGEKLPPAFAVINPKLKSSEYPFRELSGGGVIFKLIQALMIRTNKITVNDLKWTLDLVAITTICDMVPLVDENRIFTKFGLKVLQKSKRVGLNALYEVANIDKLNIGTYTVGFQIGPRLNAPGRLEIARDSYELLVADNHQLAHELAKELNKINLVRQENLDKILLEAKKEIETKKLYQNKVICLANKKWSSGLIGLVAGKITEEYSRPCFIFEKGETFSKGSARSIDNFHLVEVLSEIKIIRNFGGHAKAAGLTVATEKLDHFFSELLSIANKKLTDIDLTPKIIIDAQISIDQLTLEFYNQLEQLEPFGLGNSRPVFLLNKVKAHDYKLIGEKSKHLKFKVNGIDCIAFNQAEKISILENDFLDLVFNFDKNVWNGSERLQLKIIDLKSATVNSSIISSEDECQKKG